MKESLKQYVEYVGSEDEFSYKVRMEGEWDDDEYHRFITLLLAVIDDYKDTDLMPVPVMLFFTSQLNHLVGTISHPDFFNNTTKEYEELVNTRKTELLELQKKFFSGELLIKTN
ncbi:hypothetical protein [Chitinophaga rupis]|nr:hypothetical protein [Chitinophaga rupis]